MLDARTPDQIVGYDEFRIAQMIVIDASALVAVVQGEPDADD